MLQLIKKLLPLFLCLSTSWAFAQSMDELLEESTKDEVEYTKSAFKSSRVINLQSLENTLPHTLDFRISHRFGTLNSGAYELWGLDNAFIRFNFEYAPKEWLMFGLARSSYQKTYEGFFKLKLLRQSTGAKNMPVTLILYSDAAINTELRSSTEGVDIPFSARMTYVNQLILGRKFNEKFSFQVTPMYIHKGLVERAGQSHHIFAVGLAGRFKVSKRVAITSEWIPLIPDDNMPTISGGIEPVNSFSAGVDIETGGHVFQLHLTNSRGMVDKAFITETTGKWLDGDIYFGFNIMRAFSLKKKN